MPKIVDKDAKKRNIAIASIDLFAEYGLKAPMDLIAKAANVGKGTVYLYFKTKEEIILEIWDYVNELIYNEHKEKLQQSTTASEKISILFDYSVLEKDGLVKKLIKVFALSISLILVASDFKLQENYRTDGQNELNEIKQYLQEGIDRGEFRDFDVDMLGKLLQKMHKGIVIDAMCQNTEIDEMKNEVFTKLDFILDTIKKENR